jgi:NADP-dependent 3-hydroxy acid dehydrogenase YdfG
MGESATTYVVDVTKSDDIHKTADEMRRDIGDVEILVNNAGMLYGGEVLKLKETHIRRVCDVLSFLNRQKPHTHMYTQIYCSDNKKRLIIMT